jgi:hypothetical protein
LIRAFIEKKEISNSDSELPNIFTVDIAHLKILLSSKKCENSPNKYTLYDYFNSYLAFFYEDDNKDLRTSPYTYLSLNRSYYHSISNIDYEGILPSYIQLIDGNKKIYNCANNDMLVMILAYDEGKGENMKLLKAIKQIAEWLINSTNDIPIEIKELNYLQVIKRERQLNRDEMKQLHLIAERKNISEDGKVGAYLLLENQIAAEIHFDKMDIQSQEQFKRFPIFKFWNETENKQS